ncbi:pimeloyl-ACP methyl ester carboxylesterase [Jatrophihabitans sp. GAS493]|uniref:alpha/beta fold hydrolase n=1 Tax=Jatrophihabitans sp. GAS493 TaxID=1907575 RepID=UPI000BB97044|nr:alpha/beta hydrolase [Jatrophihabitans sp. GAS493]SOD73204.1 pimeloyl-ACP methyl ester carboxylesterase [Jatrophihabitans sp. GAS493]
MTFVLVCGGGFCARSWDRMLPFLSGRYIAVDLPGRESRAAVDLRTVTPDDCARAIVADMDAAEVTDAVLVGHSLAGVIVPRVLAIAPERFKAAICIAAIIPGHGQTVMATMAPATRAAVVPTIAGGIYRPRGGAGIEMLCNDLDAEQTEFVIGSRTDESALLLTEPNDLSGLTPAVPRWYVHLTRDLRVPPDLQERSNTHWCGYRVSLDTGHMAMVAKPLELAQLLDGIRRNPLPPERRHAPEATT